MNTHHTLMHARNTPTCLRPLESLRILDTVSANELLGQPHALTFRSWTWQSSGEDDVKQMATQLITADS